LGHARATAQRLITRWRALPARHPERFDLWLTYHCYYRKPDWLGPIVTRALGVPYALVEASHAPRRAQGPTRLGHRAVERALAAADLVLTVNPRDAAGVRARLRPGAHQVWLPPFIDTRPFDRVQHAANDPPLLLSVGMMRTRDKLDSYRVLADALGRLKHKPWRALLVGDGPARGEVEAALAAPPGRAAFLGQLAAEDLPGLYAACDLLVWPAVNEAFGMAFLEAHAAALPAVAGEFGGVAEIVAHERTGLLAAPGDAASFAAAVAQLLDDPARRRAMGTKAWAKIAAEHALPAAGQALDRILKTAIADP